MHRQHPYRPHLEHVEKQATQLPNEQRAGEPAMMLAPHGIETNRLYLRPLVNEDADALHRLWTDPDVRRYFWDGEVIPRSKTYAIVGENVARFQAHGHGIWAVFLKSEVPLIGFCGYWSFYEPPVLELLFGLTPSRWGQGFATESACAVIRYGFEHLGFDSVRASVDAPNAASLRVIKKIGMTFEKRVVVDGLDTIFYTLPRAAFKPDEAFYRVRPP